MYSMLPMQMSVDETISWPHCKTALCQNHNSGAWGSGGGGLQLMFSLKKILLAKNLLLLLLQLRYSISLDEADLLRIQDINLTKQWFQAVCIQATVSVKKWESAYIYSFLNVRGSKTLSKLLIFGTLHKVEYHPCHKCSRQLNHSRGVKNGTGW